MKHQEGRLYGYYSFFSRCQGYLYIDGSVVAFVVGAGLACSAILLPGFAYLRA